MTAKTPITIPEITWTLVAKNIDASEVTVVHSRFCKWTAKNPRASECDAMTKFVFATVAALLE